MRAIVLRTILGLGVIVARWLDRYTDDRTL
jgi:hypothetical protein